MNGRRIITTLAITGAIVGGVHVGAKAQTFNQAVVGNLGGYPELHMRSSATVNSSIIGELPTGAKVNIIAQNNGWAKINYEGMIGFVSSYYLNSNNNNSNSNSSNNNSSNSNNNNSNSSNSQTIYTNYNISVDEYAKLQNNVWDDIPVSTYAQYINPNNYSSKYEFLRIDRYRNINVNQLNQILNNKGVLEGQGQVINNAAKRYNLDPLYLAAQTILETGYGQSSLASGVTIDSIANTNAPIYKNGQLVGYQMIKLPQPVTVFNLFGIGAQNNLPGFSNRALILGTTYAYQHGWTSVPRAIYGAANFLSNIYVNNPNVNQNTPYKLRYIPDTNAVWHEYATRANYGQEIGRLISEYSYIYNSNDTFLFDKPVFN
ncbi:MAG: glucosaminidase domain-containing protein [Sarcina sp.]